MKRFIALILALVMVIGLAACGGKTDKPATDKPCKTEDGGTATTDTGDFIITVNVASEPQTIDPALNSAVDGAMMINHVFEGLVKWEDDGQGNAVITEGQAATITKGEPKEDGSITYSFDLRDGIKWSDGKDVVAGDFEYSLKRLVDPATAADYNYMADMIVNALDIMASEKDPSELGVRAIDDKTLEIDITYDCPFFLEVLAFPALMPVRQDIIEASGDQWTFEVDSYIGNGPMKMTEWVHNSYIMMVPNEEYYNRESVTVDGLKWALMDDFNAMLNGFRSGELDYIQEVPVDEVQTLLDSDELHVVDYVGTYYACFNNQRAPFDDARVRKAFNLVIDRNYIVEEITRTGQLPAGGFVPAGVNDKDPSGDDFRTIGGNYYDVSKEAYEANCEEARELLADAGYPNGEGFPIVEYLYNTSENHKIIGEALQNMWATELGVTVTLNNQDWAVFLDTRKNHDYDISRNGWIADYNDPISFLDMWLTGGGNNDAAYSNPKYDEAINVARGTSVPEERMKAMHEAEDIMMGQDSALAPIYFYTQKYMLNDELEGMYYTPLGYFFFMSMNKKG